jgi:hypothetical protein
MTTGNGNGKQQEPKTLMVPQAGEVARQEFGAQQLAVTGELASAAMATQARAAIEARYVMALQRPRDLMVARSKLLKDCSRPAFADAAIYRKPVGDGIEGPSIRLAEAAARAMTNIDTSTTVLYDDAKKRIFRVSATDLESNLTFTKDVTFSKTMERSSLRQGQVPISSRMNSRGKVTYLVAAETDDDILNTENALASKALRVCLLRLIPGDILDEAMREAYATLEKNIKEDPDAAIKKMCDRFELELGITAAQIKDYLGHPIGETTVAEIAVMRKVFNALSDGETNWSEVMQNKGSAPQTKPKDDAEKKAEDQQPASNGAQSTATQDAPGQQQPAASTSGSRAGGRGQQNLSDVARSTRARRESAAQPPAAPPEDRGDDPMDSNPNWDPGRDTKVDE